MLFIDIDTQKDFLEEDGAMAVPHAYEIRANLHRLTEYAQSRHILIISSLYCRSSEAMEGKIPETLLPGRVEIKDEHVEGDFAELLKDKEQVILESHSKNLFDTINALDVLKASGEKKCVVYGLTTEDCVRNAVIGLLENGFEVTLVLDAIKAADKNLGKKALNEMQDKGAKFLHTRDICMELNKK